MVGTGGGERMTEKEAWSKIRVINYLLQNIDDALGERDVRILFWGSVALLYWLCGG